LGKEQLDGLLKNKRSVYLLAARKCQIVTSSSKRTRDWTYGIAIAYSVMIPSFLQFPLAAGRLVVRCYT
jgi:hypothetical protein